MNSPVSIVRCKTYDEEEVRKAVQRSIELIGGMESFVKRGNRVLIKPNLLYGKKPEQAVTTHPSIVRAIIELVKEAGGIPCLGDSPGIGTSHGVAEKAGIKKVAEELSCPIIEFNRPVLPPERKGRTFKNIEIDQAIYEAEVIINLPKWKTHGQMLLTLGIKNLFGCIPGPRKALWHLKAGEDPVLFARMLVDIYQLIQPHLTVLDGIVGMEGNGPNSGHPIPLGLVLASPSPLSLDQVVCDLLGIPRKTLLTNRVALEQGLGEEEIEIRGEKVKGVRIPHFKLPKMSRVDWYIPKFLKATFKNALNAKPVIDEKICKACHQCVEVCPPKALKKEKEGLAFDYGKCIRCFCCQEICPEAAITIEPGWALKLAGRGR